MNRARLLRDVSNGSWTGMTNDGGTPLDASTASTTTISVETAVDLDELLKQLDRKPAKRQRTDPVLDAITKQSKEEIERQEKDMMDEVMQEIARSAPSPPSVKRLVTITTDDKNNDNKSEEDETIHIAETDRGIETTETNEQDRPVEVMNKKQSQDDPRPLRETTNIPGSIAATHTPVSQSSVPSVAPKNLLSQLSTPIPEEVTPRVSAEDESSRTSISKPTETRMTAETPEGSNMDAKVEADAEPVLARNNDDEFEDDFEFSEADLAAIDAVETRASETRSSTDSCPAQPVKEEPEPTSPLQPESNKIDDDDPFDSMPLDDSLLMKLDQMVANRQQQQQQQQQHPQHCLSAPNTQPELPPKVTFVFPPVDQPINNKRRPSFDPSNALPVFSRYMVVSVEEDHVSYAKAAFVAAWDNQTMLSHGDRRGIPSEPGVSPSNHTPDGHVILRGEWYYTTIEPGTIIHVCSMNGAFRTDKTALPLTLHNGPPPGSDQDDDLVLIVHPDILVPPTTVSETISCSRRAVLKTRIGSTGLSGELRFRECRFDVSLFLFFSERERC